MKMFYILMIFLLAPLAQAQNLEVVIDKPEVLDSMPSSPPGATDDAGTPGKGGYEINLITNCDLSHGTRDCESGIDAAIGIGDKVQFRVNKAYTRSTSDGSPTLQGVGPTDAGFKIRFYDKNGWQIATFPSYRFDDATKQIGLDGAPIETEGRSVYLPLILSKDISGNSTLVANLGYRKNFDHSENSSMTASIAIGHALSGTSKVMAEVATESSLAMRIKRTDVRVGWVKVIFSNSSSNYQTSIFASLGKSIGRTEDGRTHVSVQSGLQFTRKPTN